MTTIVLQKLCQDCCWLHDAGYGFEPICLHEKSKVVNPVTGKENWHFCLNFRQDPAKCGPQGQHFEPKPAQTH